MAYSLFWQIPPFSRNDKTFVLRGLKMRRLRRLIFNPYAIDLASFRAKRGIFIRKTKHDSVL